MMTEEQKQDLAAECRRTIVDAEKPGAGYRTVARGEIARIALSALTRHASPALKFPDGWVAVPVEPTDKMWAAGCQALEDHDTAKATYQAMLDAAPAAPYTAPIEPICATGGAEWVEVSNNTPEPNSKVIAYTAYGEMIFDMHYMWSKYDKEWMTEYSLWRGAVTHWMYHPTAPEEE